MSRRKDEGGLGFKELRCFNLAMLAKQWWRLHHNQDTIVFKILKAKYFPKTGLEDAKLGLQPSYLWRSIMQSNEMFDEGKAWCVGNGASIRVVRDKWIGTPFPERMNPPILNNEDMRVADLIDHERRDWREDLVKQWYPVMADKILATTLCSQSSPDRMVWGFTTHGRFTVGSANRLAVSMFSKRQDHSTGTSPPTNLWIKLWELNITPKMKNFAWQACNEGLPTLSNLLKQGLDVNPIC